MLITRFVQRSAAACVLAATCVAAHAVDAVFSGDLLFNTDLVRIDFSVDSSSDVTLYTDSWQAGLNFDPTLALFDASSRSWRSATTRPIRPSCCQDKAASTA